MPPVPAYWLIKSEPSVYAWAKLVREKKTRWDGVRNFEARNNLRAMKLGDLCLFYHSNEGKQIVGVARVVKEAYPDPTAEEGDWSVVDVAAEYPFAEPVGLDVLKGTAALADLELVRRSRLSVTKVTPAEWKKIHALGKTKPQAKK